MNTISKLKASEYKEGASLALDNSKRVIKSVEAIASIGEYQIAISLMITAIEELCKASILQIKAIDTDIQIRNLPVYFRSHQLKHDSIFNITTSSFKILNDKENRGNSDNIEDLDSKNAGMFIILTIIALFLAIAVNSKQNDDSDAENNTKDKTLEEIRQLGLYFNFDREKNEWIVPKNQFTKEDYECSKGLFDVVMEVINAGLFSGNMSKTDMKDLVNDLQDIDITI